MTQYPESGIHWESSGLLQRAWVTAPAPPSAAHTPCLLSSCWAHSIAAVAHDVPWYGISKVRGLLLQLGCVFTNSISGTLFRMPSLSFFMAPSVLGLPLLHWLHLHRCLFWSPPVQASAAFHDLFMPLKPNQCYMGDSYTVRNVVAMVVAFFSLPSSLPFPLFLSPHFPLWDKSVEKFSYYSSGLALGFSGFRTAKKYISALYKHPVSDTCYSSVPRHVPRMSSCTSHICSTSLSELLSFSYIWWISCS